VPHVQAVVPMGRDLATATVGNVIDEKLDQLREAVKAGDEPRIRALAGRLRQLAELLRSDIENTRALTSATDELDKGLAVVDKVRSEAFWNEFLAHPFDSLDELDATFAPLQAEGSVLFLAYLGTDLDLFAQKFDTFEIVRGTAVPTGERGFLFANDVYEKLVKNGVAHALDEIQDARHKDGKRIDGPREAVLREQVARLARQSKKLVYELGPDETAAVTSDLRRFLGKPAAPVEELIKELLTLTEENADARAKAFYDFVAPRIRLYQVNIGDTLTLRAFTKSGYTRAQNLKVYGTFKFRGLDGSLLASNYNLMDLMSFRDLYGLMTPERRKELDAIKAQVGVKDVAAASAEDELFGGGGDLEQAAATGVIEAEAPAAEAGRALGGAFTQDDIDGGVVVHAAVLLDDRAPLGPTLKNVEETAAKAGLKIKTLDWQKAAGIIGQFIFVMRLVLIVAFVIIFITALAIINNSMLMSMMDRIMEIGTMRAIGAQRRFVLAMFLLESTALSVGAIVVGLLGAWGVVRLLDANDLPSAGTNNILVVLFGGPHLHPHLTGSAVMVAAGCIGFVSLVATLYPAIIATRVAPVVAMQKRE
jgi:ABC-type lipoprotein release transport system permease subunit